MKLLKFISIGFGGILIIILASLYYFDVFTKIEVSKREMSKITFAFKKHQGAYKDVGELMDELYKELKLAGVESSRGIGIYLDNPANTKEKDLRSLVGSILEGLDDVKLAEIKSKFKVATLPAGEAFYSYFPCKNKISYMIGPMKVWPAIGSEIEKLNAKPSAGIEIYDIKNKRTEFYMLLQVGNDLFTSWWDL